MALSQSEFRSYKCYVNYNVVQMLICKAINSEFKSEKACQSTLNSYYSFSNFLLNSPWCSIILGRFGAFLQVFAVNVDDFFQF